MIDVLTTIKVGDVPHPKIGAPFFYIVTFLKPKSTAAQQLFSALLRG